MQNLQGWGLLDPTHLDTASEPSRTTSLRPSSPAQPSPAWEPRAPRGAASAVPGRPRAVPWSTAGPPFPITCSKDAKKPGLVWDTGLLGWEGQNEGPVSATHHPPTHQCPSLEC